MAIKHRAVKVLGETGRHEEWNDDHTIDGDVDFNKHEMQQAVVENRTDWPAAPVAGQVIYRSDLTNFFGWNGTMWLSLTPVATLVVAADGTGNYTDIQEAIDALPAGGGVVYIKEGSYVLSDTVTINKSNVSLIGAGHSTIISLDANKPVITADSKNYITIENLYIIGSNDVADTLNNGVYLYNSDYCILAHLWITQTGARGIYFRYSGASVIAENFITNCLDDGIYVYELWQSIISNNIVKDCGGDGIYLREGENCCIDGNTVEGNAQNGMDVSVMGWSTFVGNVCFDNTLCGFLFWNCWYCTITGNTAHYNRQHGMHVWDTGSCTLTGNELHANDYLNTASFDGICLIDSYDCVISSNSCIDNDRYEINISNAGCEDNIVIGNACRGNDHVGAINDAGTNTHPNGVLGTNALALDDLNVLA